MQRYFAEVIDNNIILNKDDIFHITKVMRNKKGDEIHIVADGKLYLARIDETNPFKFSIVEEVKEDHELNGYIRLLYCLPKGEKLDLVIQKAVELGADEIVLVNSSRTIRRLDNVSFSSKLVRFNKIIKEASEQCKRTKLLKMTDLIDYKDIKNYKADYSFIAYEDSGKTSKSLYEDLAKVSGKTVDVLVGAEGGFSLEEVEYAEKAGFKRISLGKRILRSETSCIYILSLLSFFMEAKL